MEAHQEEGERLEHAQNHGHCPQRLGAADLLLRGQLPPVGHLRQEGAHVKVGPYGQVQRRDAELEEALVSEVVDVLYKLDPRREGRPRTVEEGARPHAVDDEGRHDLDQQGHGEDRGEGVVDDLAQLLALLGDAVRDRGAIRGHAAPLLGGAAGHRGARARRRRVARVRRAVRVVHAHLRQRRRRLAAAEVDPGVLPARGRLKELAGLALAHAYKHRDDRQRPEQDDHAQGREEEEGDVAEDDPDQ
mmetsp:Transcript_2298/g.6704  ORF Transcript_2298/g.6704 Transcript_2298/m.6704 type:complete len:246 (-) Transcript_2298:56-793(-)